MNTMKKNGGFTLVELIIVIAILAILSTGAIAGYSRYIQNANNTAIEAVLSDISTSAVLANAQAGAVSGIEVTEANGKLEIKVTMATVAGDFKSLFADSLKATYVEASGVYTINLPTAWKNSEYKNGAEWNGAEWSAK